MKLPLVYDELQHQTDEITLNKVHSVTECFMSVFFIVNALLFSFMFSHMIAILNLAIATYDNVEWQNSCFHMFKTCEFKMVELNGVSSYFSQVVYFHKLWLLTILKITSSQLGHLIWVYVNNLEHFVHCEHVAKRADTICPPKKFLVFTFSRQLNVPVRFSLQQLALWRVKFDIRWKCHFH